MPSSSRSRRAQMDEYAGAEVPERQGKALLGWVQEPDVRPLFYGTAVTSPGHVEKFVDNCKIARDARASVPAYDSMPPTAAELPSDLAKQVADLQATDQFRTQYQPFGAQFVTMPVADLLTPQWWVDAQYVDALAADAPAEDDLEGMFAFSFATGQLARPMLLGTNAAAFASARNDIGGLTPLRVAHYSPEKVTFEFDAIPRPNWVWVAFVQDIGRVLILNGVHHLLALQKAGREHAFCLARGVGSLGELQGILNFQDPGLFKQAELSAPRPPLLRDYLDDLLASEVGIRLRQNFLRLAVATDPGVIPRID